ncbi:hypothetical protein B0H12DRAFT_965320, partial [Mycena haematopus]
ALNVVIRMEPSQRLPIKGRYFFTDKSRMLINIDISTGVMYQPGRLIKLCLSFL